LGVFAQQNADIFILGMFFSPLIVGIYKLAEKVIEGVLKLTTRPFQVVSLAHFSQWQDDKDELSLSILKFWKLSMTIAIPLFVLVISYIDYIILLLGNEWLLAVVVIKILAIIGALKTFTLFIGTLLTATKKQGLQAIVVWVFAVATVLFMMLASFYTSDASPKSQLVWIAISKAVAFIMVYGCLSVYVLKYKLNIILRQVAGALSFGVVIGFVCNVLGVLVNEILTNFNVDQPVAAISAMASFVSLYFLCLYKFLWPEFKAKRAL